MPVRVLTIPFDLKNEVFQDEELNKFLLNKQVKTLRPEFFQIYGRVYWTVFIEYESILPAEPRGVEAFDEPQKLLFQRLREWRKEKAEKDGSPPFIIATNSELAAVVKHAPRSLEALRQIRGFGQKKVEKYGNDILAIINAFYEKKPVRSEKTQKTQSQTPQTEPDA